MQTATAVNESTSQAEGGGRVCDVCGTPETQAVTLVQVDRGTLCEAHALEQAMTDEQQAEIARHLRPLLEHRYRFDARQFLEDLRDMATLRDDIVLELVAGDGWPAVYSGNFTQLHRLKSVTDGGDQM